MSKSGKAIFKNAEQIKYSSKQSSQKLDEPSTFLYVIRLMGSGSYPKILSSLWNENDSIVYLKTFKNRRVPYKFSFWGLLTGILLEDEKPTMRQ